MFEDGRPQEISAFSLVDIPAPRQDRNCSTPSAPFTVNDVKSNAQPISGRLYLIVLDDLNVSPHRTQVVVRSARQLIERHFGSNDIAAVTYTSGRADAGQEFTSERALLLAAIDKFQGRKLRSTVLEKADQYFQQHLKELDINAPNDTDPQQTPQSGKFGARSVTRISQPTPTISSAAIARNRCSRRYGNSLNTWVGFGGDAKLY